MGREVRMVPPNWAHPERDPEKNQYRHKGLQPMYDERFDDRFAEWLADFDRVRAGNLNEIERECYTSDFPLAEWLLDEGTPLDPTYYRPWHDEEATWFQVWETVSEGTPVTPPFATQAELVDYLVANGDEWDRKRGHGGWPRAAAEQFVGRGWSPSMVVEKTETGTKIFEPRDGTP